MILKEEIKKYPVVFSVILVGGGGWWELENSREKVILL